MSIDMYPENTTDMGRWMEEMYDRGERIMCADDNETNWTSWQCGGGPHKGRAEAGATVIVTPTELGAVAINHITAPISYCGAETSEVETPKPPRKVSDYWANMIA